MLLSVVAEHQETRTFHALRASAGAHMSGLHTCFATPTHLLAGRLRDAT